MRNDFESNYLAHHGILGMKWGKKNGPPYQLSNAKHDKIIIKRGKKDAKEGNKWATSKHQPSSLRASLAAGSYAAHPTKRSGARLDKLNERDALRYKTARQEYKKYTPKQREENKSSVEKRNANQTKIVSTVAGTLAAKSIVDSFANWQAANALVEGYARIPVSKLVTSSAVQAGKVAAAAAIATYGGVKIAQMAKEHYDDKKHK